MPVRRISLDSGAARPSLGAAPMRSALAARLLEDNNAQPILSPEQGLIGLGDAAVKGWFAGKADRDERERRQAIARTLMDAGTAMRGKPAETQQYGDGTEIAWNAQPGGVNAMAAVLMGNPDTAMSGLQAQIDEDQNRKELAQRLLERDEDIAAKKDIAQFQADLAASKPVVVGRSLVDPRTGKALYEAPATAADAPASVQEWNTFKAMPPTEQERYLLMKRANPYINLGGSMAQPSQTAPGTLNAEIPKTLAPEQAPDLKGKQTEATERAKASVEKETLRPKAQSALRSFEGKADVVMGSIDKALEQIGTWTAGAGSLLASVPASGARDLSNTLDTIRANIGFDTLEQMRLNSPTGGALGAISDTETRLLQAVQGALDQGQSPDQLKANLTQIKDLYRRLRSERNEAFNRDFPGGAGSSGSPKRPDGIPEAEWNAMSDEDRALWN